MIELINSFDGMMYILGLSDAHKINQTISLENNDWNKR